MPDPLPVMTVTVSREKIWFRRKRTAINLFGGSLFARPVLDDLDDARQILLCPTLKDAMLQD